MSPRPYRLGRRRPAAERTRARVLRAARALLTARAGAEPFSVEAVARRAGVARMTVYHQFGSRRGLQHYQEFAEIIHRVFRRIETCDKVTLAAVNGWALAGGLETALACDIRIASERAMFGSFEARRGYHHGDGGIVRLVDVCGAGVALEMLLTAEPIDAQRALQCNMVSRIVPHDELLGEAEKTARQILRNSQRAVRSAKETILDVIGRPLDEQLRIEAVNGYSCADVDETKALLGRFYEKSDRGRAGRHETPL